MLQIYYVQVSLVDVVTGFEFEKVKDNKFLLEILCFPVKLLINYWFLH